MGGALRIHHQQRVPRQRLQPLPQGSLGRHRGLQLRQGKVLHRRRPDAAATLLLSPGGQIAAAVAEQAVAGKGALVHRHTLQPMHPPHGGAAPLQEGGRQKGGLEGSQLLLDHLHLQREMAPQGGIAAAHHQPAVDRTGLAGLRQGGYQGLADLDHPLAGRLGIKGAGVGQQKEQGGGMAQAGRQGGGVPAEQQRCAMHGLGAGGVVVEDDHLESWRWRRSGRPVWKGERLAGELNHGRCGDMAGNQTPEGGRHGTIVP